MENEKWSWKNHGISVLKTSGNPVLAVFVFFFLGGVGGGGGGGSKRAFL